MELVRVLFLSGVTVTHALVGYALVRGFTDANPRIGIVFGVLPDADFLFPADWGWPFVHRGLTHTPLFAGAVALAAAALTRDRTVGVAVGLAIGSHLLLDSLSPAGIDWLFPLRTGWSPGLPVHGVVATILLWAGAAGLLAWRTDAFAPLVRRWTGDAAGTTGE